MKEIHVFIVEDEALAKELIHKYFEHGRITYAAIYPESQRPQIADALDRIQEGESGE